MIPFHDHANIMLAVAIIDSPVGSVQMETSQ
jgi:hypothetical protein